MGCPIFCAEEVGHAVGRRPHALADLGPPAQTAGQAGVDVPVLVGQDPPLRAHVGLAHHGAGEHRGVDLVAGAVEEAGVDEHHAGPGGADALGEVDRRAALLVHDPDLDRVRRQPERPLDGGEQVVGERHLVRAVHLGLDHVDRAGGGVAVGDGAGEVVHRGDAPRPARRRCPPAPAGRRRRARPASS